MESNFVNIIGYQLEKVHTGVIKWLLDFKNVEVTLEQKYEILKGIYKMCHINIPFHKVDIQNISCIPEFSFGRKRKIDLVVRIDLNSNAVKYLVIEMKVDSIPYEEQLRGTYDDFLQSEKCSENDALFLLFLFGSSQVCTVPKLYGFHMFRLSEIIEIFAGKYIDKYIYNDWMQALMEEDARRNNIKLDIDMANSIWNEDDYWKEKGYRTWFPLFYYIYNELRNYSKRGYEWNIYSGQNNPVMNWGKGWLEKNIMGSKINFYWEFNYEDFVLKVMLEENNKMSFDNLNALRSKIVSICNAKAFESGHETQKRYGIYNSIYKWKYDFKKRNFTEIMQEVDTIIESIHPMLERL